jgi:hypothetical protein
MRRQPAQRERWFSHSQKIGRTAYSQALSAPVPWLSLGDAHRGARTWPTAAVSNARGPAARPPERRALSI